MLSRVSLAAAAVLLAAPGVHAQVVPGVSLDSPALVRARFMETVLEGVGEPLDGWTRAWSRGDADAVASAYAEDAYLVAPDGVTAMGRDGIRTHFQEHPERVGALEVFLQDADASHRMVMTMARYILDASHAGLGGVREEGSLLTVWVQQGRTWRIRAQVFRKDP